MMRLIRMLCGRTRRSAQVDEMKRRQTADFDNGQRQVVEKRVALERLVDQLQKDTKAWH